MEITTHKVTEIRNLGEGLFGAKVWIEIRDGALLQHIDLQLRIAGTSEQPFEVLEQNALAKARSLLRVAS